MNKRHIILLSLLQSFGGHVLSTDMQKYLFLFCRTTSYSLYHFLPYKYGSFSFSAYNDKRKLIAKGILKDQDTWVLSDHSEDYLSMLSTITRREIERFSASVISLTGKALVRQLYVDYPYYAINSDILDEILTEQEKKVVEESRPTSNDIAIYTMGYEGLSLEQYINRLIKKNIRIICDVRKNPISRKYGFSKKTLSHASHAVDIKYLHFPELGIPSAQRENLKTIDDYKKLFQSYKINVVSKRTDVLNTIIEYVNQHERLVLLCYEKDPSFCHRTIIAQEIEKITRFKGSIIPL